MEVQHKDLKQMEHDKDAFIPDENMRLAHCERIVISNVFWAGSVGFIPFPMVDMVTMIGIQLKMVNEISLEYGVKFSKTKAKALLYAIPGGLGIYAVSSLKFFPGLGTAASSTMVGLAGAATTYAIGKLFIEHFEKGGNLQDLDVQQARLRFKELKKAHQDIG